MDRRLHDLLASYAKSLREALQETFDNNRPPPPFQEDLRGDWLCKAEEYVKVVSAAVAQLGHSSSSSTAVRPKASWTSFL